MWRGSGTQLLMQLEPIDTANMIRLFYRSETLSLKRELIQSTVNAKMQDIATSLESINSRIKLQEASSRA